MNPHRFDVVDGLGGGLGEGAAQPGPPRLGQGPRAEQDALAAGAAAGLLLLLRGWRRRRRRRRRHRRRLAPPGVLLSQGVRGAGERVGFSH